MTSCVKVVFLVLCIHYHHVSILYAINLLNASCSRCSPMVSSRSLAEPGSGSVFKPSHLFKFFELGTSRTAGSLEGEKD